MITSNDAAPESFLTRRYFLGHKVKVSWDWTQFYGVQQMMIRILAMLSLILAVPLETQAQATVVPYVDDAPKDPTFSAYRAKLLTAIAARNTEWVIGLSDKDIHLSFGGDVGHDAFRDILNVPVEKLSDEYKSQAQAMRDEIWMALYETVKLGGQLDGDSFSAPYYWAADIPQSFDPFQTYFVTGARVALRDGPSLDANVLSRFNYVVVDIPNYDDSKSWQLVTIPGTSDAGYMHSDFLRSNVDYRAIFSKESGTWKMTVFIAGD